MIYFHTYKSPGLVIDIVQDIRKLNDMGMRAKKAGMIVLGGGVCKHQIANAMLFVSEFKHNLGVATDESRRGTVLIMQCISTRDKNLTAQIQELGRMKQSLGAKFGLGLNRSR